MTGAGDRAFLRWLEAKPGRAVRIFGLVFIVAQLHLWGGMTAVAWLFFGPAIALWAGVIGIVIMTWWTYGVLRTSRYGLS